MDIQELKEDSDICRETKYLLNDLNGIKVIILIFFFNIKISVILF